MRHRSAPESGTRPRSAPDPEATAAIDRLLRGAAATPGVICLAGGLPSDTQFHKRALADSFLAVLDQQGAPALQYGWPEGSEGLRRQIAQRLVARGAAVEAGDVIITSGAQQAIALVVQILLRPGARVGVDPETYPAALDLLRAQGLDPAPLDAPDLEAAYVMPGVSNPRGHRMSEEVRADLFARRIPIIEDDAYADLRFSGPAEAPLLTRDRRRVFNVGTFSKTLCPGLRVGWLVPPPRFRRRALRAKATSDLQANSLTQALVDHYLAHHDFDARLVSLRRFYARRARRLAAAVKRALPSFRFDFPEGGFALWVEADARIDERALLEIAIDEGVSFDPASLFRLDPARGPTAMRLCFSLVAEPDLEEGARRLGQAWRRAIREAGGDRNDLAGLRVRAPGRG